MTSREQQAEILERQLQEAIDGNASAAHFCDLAKLAIEALRSSSPVQEFDFVTHLRRQREWSARTFGPGRLKGVVDHIRKELDEIEAEPTKLSEWIDVVILALDGAWRAGHDAEAIQAGLVNKQTVNEARAWPDWRSMPPDVAIEHVRSPVQERVIEQERETDHARSDQPQPGSWTADQRGDDRGGSKL